ERGIRGDRRPAAIPGWPLARGDRALAGRARRSQRARRFARRSGGRAGTANGRRGAGAAYAPALRRLGRRRVIRLALATALVVSLTASAAAQPKPAPQAKPEGEMRWALYVTLAPAWFDPGEITAGSLTPFWILYALHDALVKPMPGNLMAPSLAESWTVSADQKVYEFKLREGVKFHNGDPFTAEDVKFSFQRSKVGKVLKERVRDVEIVSPSRVRFHLTEPFPDFMAFYGTLATGAGWIVPKKYVESVG